MAEVTSASDGGHGEQSDFEKDKATAISLLRPAFPSDIIAQVGIATRGYGANLLQRQI